MADRPEKTIEKRYDDLIITAIRRMMATLKIK